MKVVIRYRDNRLDIFDTTAFVHAEPFAGANMLTNFEVRIDTLGNTGLWLIAHYYDTGEAYAKQTPEGETPVARRKRGWRFLLAEEGELEFVEGVSVDGQITLLRIADELVDMVRFEQMCAMWLGGSGERCVTQRAVLLFDELCRAYPEKAGDGEAVARLCGFSLQAIDELRSRVPLADDEARQDDDDWFSDFTEGESTDLDQKEERL